MESFSFWDVLYLGEPVYKKILLSLEIIKGDFLSNSIVKCYTNVVTVVANKI